VRGDEQTDSRGDGLLRGTSCAASFDGGDHAWRRRVGRSARACQEGLRSTAHACGPSSRSREFPTQTTSAGSRPISRLRLLATSADVALEAMSRSQATDNGAHAMNGCQLQRTIVRDLSAVTLLWLVQEPGRCSPR
jgi:hypothetical protein